MNQIVLFSIFIGLVIAAMYSVQNVMMSAVSKHYNYYQLAWYTQTGALILVAALALLSRQTIGIDVWSLCIAAILGAIYASSMYFYFRALKTGPLSIVVPICESYAIIAIPIALIFLHEVLTLTEYLALALICVGVFIIEFQIRAHHVKKLKAKYLAYAFLTLLMWGLYMPIDSVLVSRVSWFAALFWELVFASIFLTALVMHKNVRVRQSRKKSTTLIRAITPIILLEVMAGLLLNYGLEHGSVSVITPLLTLSTVLTVLFAVVILRQKITKRQATGVVCAVIGVMVLGLQGW